ncbi:MAG: hypothetical protein A3K19_14985 [Lentisphaerae bacterium RIFOXYB12_FULL_65_16]|nr:MAG: hypothetical protein A3K18_01565 [Lentisphaerae bacterium RIFOXYA12_64_32]OGV85939.1 MAG: hypothetical protein A3K19_14985 [Lentisphaerae bacterium RIFOXYB12_FULL_65_16]
MTGNGKRLGWRVGLAAVCCGVAGVFSASAQGGDDGWPRPSVTLSLDAVNQYVWRGILYNQDPVLQPSATVSWFGFSANIWGSYDTTDYGAHEGGYGDSQWEFAEIDCTLSYSHTFDKAALDLPVSIGVTVGVIDCTYENTYWEELDTTEVFAGVSLPDLLLSPSVTVYRDTNQSDGLYVQGAVSHTISLLKNGDEDRLGLTLGATLGWGNRDNNEYYLGVDESGFADAGVSASLPWNIGGGVSLTPYIRYTDFVDHELRDARDAVPNASSEMFVAGATLAWGF